jgi:hypothetical protein
LLFGQTLRVGGGGTVGGITVGAIPEMAAWRFCSQPINSISPAWRISGLAVRVITANMTAKPSRAKPLCVISKKPWAMSLANVARPLVNFSVAVIALPS